MRYDLHVHTYHSEDSTQKPYDLLKKAKKIGLDGVAITDHNEIKGAFEVKKLNKDKDFEVIIGTEIKTNYGDVLAYYVDKKIKSNDFFDVVEEVRKQNGLVVIPHPFSYIIPRWFKGDIAHVRGKIDALECFNARNFFGWGNKKAFKLAEKYSLAKTAGSDAHFSFEVGQAYTVFESDLREAIKRRKTSVKGRWFKSMFGGVLTVPVAYYKK